ncbi:MAG: prolyl oligopeptidase family serine peptidase [Cyclobacteriaceae bacterium]|nr:prolyl oligopeptidase family serine peptidase [Cyclobacteriaceae bacterium]
MRNFLIAFIVFFSSVVLAQESLLSIEKIMTDPKVWVGTSPSNIQWSDNGQTLYFNWNPEKNPIDSLYKLTAPWKTPIKVSQTEQRNLPLNSGVYNKIRTLKVYSKDGDLYLFDIKKNNVRQITNTLATEYSPEFTGDEKSISFITEGNLFLWEITSGRISQLTQFVNENEHKKAISKKDEWLKNDQEDLFEVLKEERKKKKLSEEFNEKYHPEQTPTKIQTHGARVSSIKLSPDQKFIFYSLFTPSKEPGTIVPDYVTESGYTEDINARSKVGGNTGSFEVGIYNIGSKTNYKVNTEDLPGIDLQPDYFEEYGYGQKEPRDVYTHMPVISENGQHYAISFRSVDNKDRWIGLLDPATGNVEIIEHQKDNAWIAGPGIGWSFSSGELGWLPDNEHLYFQSEETGYSHLYLYNVKNKSKTPLTKGTFEVYNPRFSYDKKSWIFEANMQHPGIRQLYKMPLLGGNIESITNMGGGVTGFEGPGNNKIAILQSLSNRPIELFLIDNVKKNTDPRRITVSQTEAWNSYNWRVPSFVEFEARDGANVHARLYKPEGTTQGGPAVIFVHGAGYLQNAHQWWSSYFREYMFHNFLVDQGYTVLDVDYRGSAGYGRDWRTGIYQHMGGFDLTDQVDGAKYLVNELGIDESKIGIYGGSYGGFITLMAMFTEADTFAAGAALRSVTDWAHYNHGYTSNILNTPELDSIAYRKSSPIYYAEGLKGALLICHGMIDTNVHFQDVVRLAQRLIELGKENWEFAVFPKENHGFVHPSSWTDEYKRIYKLFEENLKN